jgi:hypothetical protein
MKISASILSADFGSPAEVEKIRMGPRMGISPEESVQGMRRVLEGFTPEDTGSFIKYDGTHLPW